MNIGYITIEKFRLIEMCEKFLQQIHVKPDNLFVELRNYRKVKKLIDDVTILKDCAETFGVKSDIVVSMELFNEIIKVIGN